MNDERQKKFFLMKMAVAGLAILILALWAFNLKNVWLADKEIAATNNSQEWVDLKENLNKTLVDVKDQLKNVQKTKDDAEQTANQALLADVLKETGQKVSALASSTATTTDNSSTSSPAVTATTTLAAPAVKGNSKNY